VDTFRQCKHVQATAKNYKKSGRSDSGRVLSLSHLQKDPNETIQLNADRSAIVPVDCSLPVTVQYPNPGSPPVIELVT
jgi:hypothetical protein